jgi:hypothetical protein
MANQVLTADIKSKGDALFSVVGSRFGEIVIRTADGKIDQKKTGRALAHGLRLYLQSTGEIARRSSVSHAIDVGELLKAAMLAFGKMAKGVGDSVPMTAVEYAALPILEVGFEDYDRARKAVHEALVADGSPFEIEKPKGVGASMLRLADPAAWVAPMPPRTWAEMTKPGTNAAPASEPPPAATTAHHPAPAAEPKAKGKGKNGNGTAHAR